MEDKNSIIIQSLTQDINQIHQHLQMQQIMIMQIIEALAAANIISIEDANEEASEEEEQPSESKLIIP